MEEPPCCDADPDDVELKKQETKKKLKEKKEKKEKKEAAACSGLLSRCGSFASKWIRPRLPKLLRHAKKIPVDLESPVVVEITAEAVAEKKRFLILLAKSLHASGSPVHRTEYHLSMAAKGLALQGMFAVLPNALFISFGDEELMDPAKAETHIYKVVQGLNCEHLFLLSELAQQVAEGKLDAEQGTKVLRKIMVLNPFFPPWVKLLCFGAASACLVPLFFDGGWVDIIISLVLGIMVGFLNLLGSKNATFSRVVEPAAATAVGLVGRLIDVYLPTDICYLGIVLSAIVWMLPGLSLTIAITELATKNIVSGTARIFNAILVAVELGYGLALGSRMVFWQPTLEATPCQGLNDWWNILFLFGVLLPFVILLDAHPHQWPPMVMCSALAYAASYFGSKYFMPDITAALAAFTVGISSSVYSRFSGKSSLVSSLAGILLLVPGSLGVRGTSSFLSNDIVSGMLFTFQMLLTGVSITVGLLSAKLILPPQHSIDPEYSSTLF